jgi:flagellar biosynthesis protein FlhA
VATGIAAKDKRLSVSELALPLGIVTIVMMMVLPIPRVLIDLLLATSLAISIGVFLIALFMEEPLEFSAFPSVILIATLLRLSLNVATTRLILLNGKDGHSAAGEVVAAFGKFVVGGNVVVGLVVFLILVVINFVVITKGAGRVAEVGARFALDGMPGKQMAIDADLNAGAITTEVARQRRKDVEREADFFGAMDGASKFVKGDAIAGLLITAINLVGGLILGVMAGMSLADAAETFSILSVGDALVSQLPALLISTAAGVVVTRSATGDQLGRALRIQLLGSRSAVAATAGVLTLIALLPGMPMLPFVAIAGGLIWLSRQKAPLSKQETAAAAAAPGGSEAMAPALSPHEDLEASLPLDLMALEVGYELVPTVDPKMGGTLVDRIASLRRQIALDLGVVIPPIHIRDNLAIPAGGYRVSLLGAEIASGNTHAGRLLAMDATGTAAQIDGEETIEPAFGTPARWIMARDRELAEALGWTVVDHTTMIATHLAETARRHAHELLGRGELSHLFEVFSRSTPKLVEDLVPNLLSLGEVLKVLRNLLKEGVSIRDLRSLLEALVELAPATRDPEQLTEMLRQRVARQISSQFSDPEKAIWTLVLDSKVEDVFRRSLREIATGTGGALDPEAAKQIGVALETGAQRMLAKGKQPVVLTAPDIRRYVRALAERRCPNLAVLSFREIEPEATLKPFEVVALSSA